MGSPHAVRSGLVALLLSTLALAACSGGSSGGGSSAPAGAPGSSSAASTPAPSPTGAPDQLYVSVGDSYAAGFQATGPNVGMTTRNGFAYQVVDGAKAKGYDLTLVNFGCGGATTTSVLQTPGCKPEGLGPGAASYDPQTQADAAEAFLARNRGRVALITVSIGGNDITACVNAADTVGCVGTALATIKTNVQRLLDRLRFAAGPDTRIVGITYPDVVLALLLTPDPEAQKTANLSVLAFKSLINPALKAQYERVDGQFVDVTAATGAYGPLTEMTDLPPYGRIPVPVAKVCQLTYFCEFQDIHPRTEGYRVISDLVVGTLPRR